MKRFLVFSGDEYYPKGGMEDFQGSFDTFQEAKNFADTVKDCTGKLYDWYHIYDGEENYIVEYCE